MASIQLPDDIFEKLTSQAEAQQKSLESLLTEWAEQPALHRLFDLSLDLMCVAGVDGNFKYANLAFSRALDYTSDELLNLSFIEFVHPADQEATLHEMAKLLQGIPTTAFENRYRARDGSYRWLLWSASYVPEEGSIYAVANDITDRKQVESELRINWEHEKELSELKSRFIAMVSHEFRTPLAVILSSAEMLKRYWERLDLEKQHDYLDRIRAHVQHLKDLVTKVLDISSNDSIEVNFKPVTLDVQQFFQELMTEIGFVVRETNKFIYEADGECTTAELDPALLRLALNNLVQNAAKYSAYGSQIDVSLRCTASTLLIEVRDNGIGIPLDEQKYLFNPFFRATNVGSAAGTGLGLAVVHQAVRAHGGSIAVESEVGTGTTFRLLLPVSQKRVNAVR